MGAVAPAKLVLHEAGTGALVASIARLDRLVTSIVGVIELARAARRVLGEPGVRAAELVAAGLTVIPVTPAVAAAGVGLHVVHPGA